MKIDLSEFSQVDKQQATKFYTLIGKESYIDEDGFPRLETENSLVFAKAIKNKLSKKFNEDTQYRFYIKTDPNKNIHNPIELYTTKDKNNRSFLNKICKTETTFTEVTQNIFNQYINFLKTRNTRWLDQAQRELK
jgi:hypothetical protein